MFENFLDLLFPPACCICGKINKDWLCTKCKKRVERLIKNSIDEVKEKNYEKLLYIFKYESLIRKLMLGFKFSNKAYISNFFVSSILEDKEIVKLLKSYDMIISVPMHKKKQEKRGYNQTDLIANKISKNINIPFKNNVIKKVINTTTQSKLTGKARKNNIRSAFFIQNDFEVEDKKIILLDDIYTTGSTTEECSRILKKSGAKEILALIMAKD